MKICMPMRAGAIALVSLSAMMLHAAEAPSVVTTPQITTDASDRKATLTWVAPTQYVDGSSINETLSYNIYEGLCTLATLPKVATVSVLTAARTVANAGAYCWQISAQTPNGGESALTGRGSKTFPWARPNAPPSFTVQ